MKKKLSSKKCVTRFESFEHLWSNDETELNKRLHKK